MAKALGPIVVSDVLVKQSQGTDISLREARAVAKAVGDLRDRFNNDMFKAMQDPSALEPGELECIIGLATLLFEYGFLSKIEMENFQAGIRMMLE